MTFVRFVLPGHGDILINADQVTMVRRSEPGESAPWVKCIIHTQSGTHGVAEDIDTVESLLTGGKT